MSSLPIFDNTEYKALEEILGTEKTLEIYEEYKLDAAPRIQSLSTEKLGGDQRHKHLHTMASMSGNMGFKRMEAECRRLMDAMPSMDEAAIMQALNNLADLYEQGCSRFELANGQDSTLAARAANN